MREVGPFLKSAHIFYCSSPRKRLVQLMMEEEDDGAAEEGGGGVDSALSQHIEVKKRIIEVNRQLCKLKKLALISKMASSSEPTTSLKTTNKQSSSESLKNPSDPISEGASSSCNGVVGEVKNQGGSNFTVPPGEVKGHPTAPPPDAAKSEGTVNIVDNEATNATVKTDNALKSQLCPNAAPFLPGSGIADVENVDVNIHECTAEVDPLLGDFPDAAAEEDDSVFIDENGEELTTPALTAAPPGTTSATAEWKSDDEEEGEAPIIAPPPPSSKTYSSVASSPPTNSSLNRGPPPTHQRQQQSQEQQQQASSLQQLYPPRYFRASSLPPSSSTAQPPPTSSTQSPTKYYGQEQGYYRQRPPSPAVYPTRPQGSEFIPVPSAAAGAGASYLMPIEQEWPTLHDSKQQPRRVRAHNSNNYTVMVSSNQNPPPSQRWSLNVGSSSTSPASETPPTSVLGSPPTPGPIAVLGSPPFSSMRRSSSSSAPNFSNPLLPTPATAQSNLPPRFAKLQQTAAVTSRSTNPPMQGIAKRRPAGIGRGGRPLPPLDNSMLGGGVGGVGGIGRGVPPVRPIIMSPGYSGGRPPIPPHLYNNMETPVVRISAHAPPGMRGRPLLPSPLPPSVVMPPPVTSPIPVSPEERWIYMSRRGRQRSKYDYPPLGSSAGLDII